MLVTNTKYMLLSKQSKNLYIVPKEIAYPNFYINCVYLKFKPRSFQIIGIDGNVI